MPSGTKNRPATLVASLEIGEQTARRLAGLFAESFDGEDIAVSLVDSGDRGLWRVLLYFQNEPDKPALRALASLAAGPAAAKALRFQRVAAKDWIGESLMALKPVEAGRFFVHGAHDRARVPVNRIDIEIDAALAFGTGHHGTTRGCLLALERLCKARWRRPLRILDLGTGSGVLAIAAAHALRQRVVAVDIDPNAVRTARANVRQNRAAAFVEVGQADGVKALRRPFDLVFANILLGPLQRLAVPLTRLAAPGARVVLSGLLVPQANAALAAYRRLALERRIEIDGWVTLVLTRHAAFARRGRGP